MSPNLLVYSFFWCLLVKSFTGLELFSRRSNPPYHSLETKSLTTEPCVSVLDLEYQFHQLTLRCELSSVVSYVLLTYRGMFGPEIHGNTIENSRYIINCWSWYFKLRTGIHCAVVIYLVSKLWGYRFRSHQVPLARTAEEFQTERNSYPFQQNLLLLMKYLSNQLIWCINSTVSWSSNGKSWISGPTIPLYVSITFEVM